MAESQETEERLVRWLNAHTNGFLYRDHKEFCLFRSGRAFEDWAPEGQGKDLAAALDAAGAPK